MNCLAGVDEAGLGPILGPLVVAGAALSGPRGVDPWKRLRGVVCRERPERMQVQVADSKRVKQGPRGLERLERTVLAFWTVLSGRLPATLAEWLDDTGNELAAIQRCPWYEDLELRLPLVADRGDIELAAHLLERRLVEEGIELSHIAVRPVEVEEFNALIDDTDNKSHTHFHVYAEVITSLLRRLPPGAHLVADRCGGRRRYRTSLQKTWSDGRVRTLREGTAISSYRLERADGTLRVSFATQGEDRAFPTALASCAAKYLRELMVHRLNSWFRERIPDLRPTAGYYGDGRRFLRDIGGFARREGLPLRKLIRSR